MRPPLERAKPQESQQNPIIREEFYNQLNSLSSEQKNSKHLLLFIGDFNAKIGSVYPRFSESIGEFGKGISNSNCEHLLKYATQNDLVLTNTLIPYKMVQGVTPTEIKLIISSVKTWTKSFCRNQNHIVEQERKLITNLLKLLLNWTGGESS